MNIICCISAQYVRNSIGALHIDIEVIFKVTR